MDIEDTISKLSENDNIKGIVISNTDGIIIRNTISNEDSANKYSTLISGLVKKTKIVISDLDPTNELTFLRIRSLKHELLISLSNLIGKLHYI